LGWARRFAPRRLGRPLFTDGVAYRRERAYSQRQVSKRLWLGAGYLALHHKVGADLGELELLGDDAEAGAFIQGTGGCTRVAPYARGTMGDGVPHKRVEDRCTCPLAACVRVGRHATHSPGTRLAVGCYEPDGYRCPVIEDADRKCAGGLVRSDTLNRFVRPQNRLAKPPSFGK
jgi:hypothetical protein